MNRESKIG